jgi:hypothetical protein
MSLLRFTSPDGVQISLPEGEKQASYTAGDPTV